MEYFHSFPFTNCELPPKFNYLILYHQSFYSLAIHKIPDAEALSQDPKHVWRALQEHRRLHILIQEMVERPMERSEQECAIWLLV